MAERPEFSPKVNLRNGHVLIIDDQDVVRQQVRSTLAEGGHFTRFTEAADGLEGFQLLLQKLGEIDLILCDVEMPQIDGFKFLSLKSSKPELEEVPVIMLTTRGEDEHRIRGLELGASDYILKPFIGGELAARASNQMKIRRLVQALRAQAAELERLSNTDPLTRTFNRRYLMQQLEGEFSRAMRYGHQLGLIICDIDHFKLVNDKYGHQVGDGVLVEVAAILQENRRAHDIVARYGGEEFCIVLPETDLDAADSVAERYRAKIASHHFVVDANDLQVKMSFGVAGVPDSRPATMDDLIRYADIALYQAKEAGRNLTVRFRHKE